MSLPFTHDQFLNVFGAYNFALWPAVAILWLLTAVAVGSFATGRVGSRPLAGLLAVHWLWSGAVYQLAYFATINPAARIFGVAFILEAGLIGWFGVVRSRLHFQWSGARGIRSGLAAFFCLYALMYPLLALAAGFSWPRMPVFGVPCPTTLLTVGSLLSLQSTGPRAVSIVPLLWCFIGGSAALFLGVVPDLALLLAGAVLLVDLLAPRMLSRARAA